jgi:hypothetical protein
VEIRFYDFGCNSIAFGMRISICIITSHRAVSFCWTSSLKQRHLLGLSNYLNAVFKFSESLMLSMSA